MKKNILPILLTFNFFCAYAQDIDTTLTLEEIQFRDSIAAINTNNALIQEIQESYNAGTEAFASSNFKEAITFFESVIALDSANADAHFNKGLSHKELKNYEVAISDFESTFSIDDSYLMPFLILPSVTNY